MYEAVYCPGMASVMSVVFASDNLSVPLRKAQRQGGESLALLATAGG